MEKTEGEKKMNFDEIYDRKGTHCVKYNAVKTAQRPQDALVMTLADMDLPCWIPGQFRSPPASIRRLLCVCGHSPSRATES